MMKRMMMLAFGLAAMGALSIVGCGRGHGGGGGGGNGDGTSVEFALEGGDFTGNSVQISGTRVDCTTGAPLPADAKYRCDNSFTNQCFNFTQPNQTFEVGGLCPSEDIPNGCWTFTYQVFLDPGCTGTQLNADGNPNNFACYDSHDVYSQDNANMSFREQIHVGLNRDAIVCKTRNATKDFVFSSCAIVREDTNTLILDCGCTLAAGACTCGGLTPADLTPQTGTPASTCTINPDAACNVACCVDGAVDFQTDPNNCGTCGHVCTTAQTCVAGVCTP